MAASTSGKSTPPRLADRLAQARYARFVGREVEINLFRSALLAEMSPFVILHIHGPGGVGKTSLLHEFGRIAGVAGRPLIFLDGRNIELSPAGFQQAFQAALAQNDLGPSPPPHLVLLIDTYELINPLENWLRETFFPQLPPDVLAVIAGRRPPSAEWRSDPGWNNLTQVIALKNLRLEESQTYLMVRGIPQEDHAGVLAITQGHPLAMSLVVEVLNQGGQIGTFDLRSEPDVVKVLLERFTRTVSDPQKRRALEICAHVRVTSEALLAALLGQAAAFDLFDWLRGLSFIQHGPQGLFPHDLARNVLDADFHWRNPQAYEASHHQARRYFQAELQQGSAATSLSADLIYLTRYYSAVTPYFDFEILSQAYFDPVAPADHPLILESVRRHEGQASADIARYWLQKQPQAFVAFRTAQQRQIGFVVLLILAEITAEDISLDPAVAMAQSYVQQKMPLRPNETINIVRFWMGHETYQQADIQTLVAVSSSITWVSNPNLAWTFAVTADRTLWQDMFAHLNFNYDGQADFTVGEHRYGVFTHNWRAEPVLQWFEWLGEQYFRNDKNRGTTPMAPDVPPLTISRPDYLSAVREALRNFARPDILADNPLLHSSFFIKTMGEKPAVDNLRERLIEAAGSLTANPKDEKFYEAVYFTYIKPTLSQEATAERLNIPLGTYRYRLAKGVERIADWFLQQEIP